MSWFDRLSTEADKRMATKVDMSSPEHSLLNQERMEGYIIKRRKFEDDFIKGQQDCEAGIPAKSDGSKVYHRGFAAQYQNEQNMREIK